MKKIKDKNGEIDLLKQMMVASKTEMKTKDTTVGKLKKRVKNLEKMIGGRGARNINSDKSYRKISSRQPKSYPNYYDEETQN